jgi:flagellar hook-basal body complex protein FliE
MAINPVLTPFPSATLGGAGTYGAPSAGKALDGFGQSLTRAVDSLSRLQQEADFKTVQLAAGEPVELHDMVEAYQDVMRMQL